MNFFESTKTFSVNIITIDHATARCTKETLYFRVLENAKEFANRALKCSDVEYVDIIDDTTGELIMYKEDEGE